MEAPHRRLPRVPFRDLPREKWINLAVAGLLTYYAAQVILNILWGNLFGDLGIDFGSFWSAGHLANQFGYSSVYNIELMGQTQRQLLPERALAISGLGVIPTPYLPVFLLPFQLLALLPPAPAAALWMALNLAGSILYLRRFSRRLAGRPLEFRLLLLVMASAPIFLNIFTGQVNLWLMICVGEFLLARRSGKPFQAGLWLAGLLLKPQTLVLIVPAVLWQRWKKTTLGMLAGAAAVIAGSWVLAGSEALRQLANLWLGYAGGLPTNDPQLMMNWRMIGFHLAGLAGPTWANFVVIAGMLATAGAALALWSRPLGTDSTKLTVASLGLFAATCTVAWHAHAHMAMLLIPPLLALVLQPRPVAQRAFLWWILLPAALYVIRTILASIMRLGAMGEAAYSLLDILAGIGLLAMNLILLGWTLRQSRPWEAVRA